VVDSDTASASCAAMRAMYSSPGSLGGMQNPQSND
jgi:hypothetical protein